MPLLVNDVMADCAFPATNAVVATFVLLSPTACVVAVVPDGSTIVAEQAATAPAAPLPHSGAVVAAEGMAVLSAAVTNAVLAACVVFVPATAVATFTVPPVAVRVPVSVMVPVALVAPVIVPPVSVPPDAATPPSPDSEAESVPLLTVTVVPSALTTPSADVVAVGR